MNQNNTRTIIKQFFQLSIFSGFFTALSGLVVMAGVLYLFVIQQSEFRDYYQQLLFTNTVPPERVAVLTEEMNRSALAADAAVFVFWMIIGLMVYIIGEILYQIIRNGRSFFDEMNHTIPANRATLAAVGLQHILLRLLGVAGLYVIYLLVLKALPIAGVFVFWFSDSKNIVYTLVTLGAACLTGAAIAYGITLCLRLVMYRLRVFGSLYDLR